MQTSAYNSNSSSTNELNDTHVQRGMDRFFMGSACFLPSSKHFHSMKKVHQGFVCFHESFSHYLYRCDFAVATERDLFLCSTIKEISKLQVNLTKSKASKQNWQKYIR